MAQEQLTLDLETFEDALTVAVEMLAYPSETDAPVEVHFFSEAEVGEAFSEEDLLKLMYPEDGEFKPVATTWAEMHRADSVGTQRFFRELLDVITIYPNNEWRIQELAHVEAVEDWRYLRDIFFDNTIDRKWFRVELDAPNSARKDIYIVGRHIEASVEEETNEVITEIGQWVVLSTYVIET